MTNTPTDVQIEIYVEEGSSTKMAHLYDNGKAIVPITVFYKVTDGTAGKVGLNISTNVSTLNREPQDMSDTFNVSEAEGEEVSGEYRGHLQNGDQTIISTAGLELHQTFFVSSALSVENDTRKYLMGYIEVPDFRENVGSAPVPARIYSNMSYGGSVNNSDQVEIIMAHKPTINLMVEEGATAEHTYSPSLFNWSNAFFVKAWYDDPDLPFVLKDSEAMFYVGEDRITIGTNGAWNRKLDIDSGFIAAVAAETDQANHKWLSRCVSNGVLAAGTVRQNGSSDGQAKYTFGMSAPFVGSFVTFCVDHLGSDVHNYSQYRGKATFYITDAYGSKSELFVIASTKPDNQQITIDSHRVDIKHA